MAERKARLAAQPKKRAPDSATVTSTDTNTADWTTATTTSWVATSTVTWTGKLAIPRLRLNTKLTWHSGGDGVENDDNYHHFDDDEGRGYRSYYHYYCRDAMTVTKTYVNPASSTVCKAKGGRMK
ncbi:hypothetical protein M8818_002002 [Zalaria obscura]|uniref:Uncharacterized protein n=1 Tax=Zalaria obscura TaxID=2024903 RepID=A0ACC3SIP8_9PEZI